MCAQQPASALRRKTRGGLRTRRGVRGAVAWKLLLGIAAGIGVVWSFAQSSLPPAETPSRAVAGPIAVRTPVSNSEQRVAAAPAADARKNDPFAGVDVSNDSVLRHIAGIDENARARQQRAPQRGAAKAATEPARPVAAPPTPPVGAEPAETQRVPNAPAEAAAMAPLLAPAPPPAPAALQTSAIEAPVTRSAADPGAATLPAVGQAVAAPPPSKADPDRTQVAALGNTPSMARATDAPLRAIARPVPPFPIEAMRAGIPQGRVVARLTVEADGRVSAARILSSTPLGYFERESRRALANWRYEPPGRQTSTDVELVFNRE